MTIQVLAKPPKTRHEMMAADFYHSRISVTFKIIRRIFKVICH